MKNVLGFRPKYSILGSGSLPPVVRAMIYNAMTLREGGAVEQSTSGVGPCDGVGANVIGYVVAFEDKDGFTYDQRTSGFAGTSATYTQSAQGDTHLSSTDNVTSGSDNVVAVMMPAFGVVCSGCLDAATGTTTGSSVAGYYISIDTAAEEKLGEDTASTTKEQFKLMPGRTNLSAIDPENPESTTRVMVLALETEQAFDSGSAS